MLISRYYTMLYTCNIKLGEIIVNVQFKKGVLTLCVLVLTAHKDRYGYELVNEISEKFVISVGSVYPLLRRLTKEEYFSTYMIESQEGPARKYYHLTNKGKTFMTKQLDEWKLFSEGVYLIIKEGLENDEIGIPNKT